MTMITGDFPQLAAMRSRNYLLTPAPWRALVYVLSTGFVWCGLALPAALLIMPAATVLTNLMAYDISIFVLVTALPLAIGVFLLGMPVLSWVTSILEPVRLRLIDDRPFRRRERGRRIDARDVQYLLFLLLGAPILYLPAILLLALLFDNWSLAGLLALPVLLYVCPLTAAAHGAVTRTLLHAKDEELAEQLLEVSDSRARLVEAHETERRRIERDLHDGAQTQLVNLTVRLGLAKMDTPPDSPAYQNIEEAHRQAKVLMSELRELVQGIHPQVLTDKGLVAALGELADRSAIPVSVHSHLAERPPRHIESTAYFIAAEALTNVAKHSGASAATVTVCRPHATLYLEVTDDGTGGADPSTGTGLLGLADRAATVDGTMSLYSPEGGPTVIKVELPWT
ncbi:sensor histidine kinase [Pseudonocardiaceae bacterium YIM PH 21723]|nr:sensor histidine kinase [Pseudonocardiaceae bacterium YIM PH 21723]